ICVAAESIGFRSQTIRMPYGKLKRSNGVCIVRLNNGRFIVVYRISGVRVYTADPALGLIRYSSADFISYWAEELDEGMVLLLQPTPKLYQEDISKNGKTTVSSFKYLLTYLRPFRSLILQLFLGFFAGSAVTLVLPFLT